VKTKTVKKLNNTAIKNIPTLFQGAKISKSPSGCQFKVQKNEWVPPWSPYKL